MPETDAADVAELSVEQCRALLSTQQVGRLGVVVDGYPVIMPVNYALDHDVVVLRKRTGSTLAALQHANVTLQIDAIDPVTHSGWSVLVRGLAEEVTEQHGSELVARTHATGQAPWAPGDDVHAVRLIPHKITGRRLVGPGLPPAFESAGYL